MGKYFATRFVSQTRSSQVGIKVQTSIMKFLATEEEDEMFFKNIRDCLRSEKIDNVHATIPNAKSSEKLLLGGKNSLMKLVFGHEASVGQQRKKVNAR